MVAVERLGHIAGYQAGLYPLPGISPVHALETLAGHMEVVTSDGNMDDRKQSTPPGLILAVRVYVSWMQATA